MRNAKANLQQNIRAYKIVTMTGKAIVWSAVGIIVLVFGMYALKTKTDAPVKLDSFAVCLKDSGAIFYGTFWCPHCQNQKAMFGKSQTLLPYVECSTPDAKSQLAVCAEKKIEGYPTWEFADGSRLTGEVALETLAEKTACALPQ